ncbi:4Fe-4S dicluster domain-containing protein [Methanocella sp. MCL-LM]|uniref:4Fe-4S dicluster domain-containing protein n=1 Tax=Methanocella sp. MCL-LM TaxID=3412035 RepID=UPI003C75849D
MTDIIIHDPALCTGCRQCMTACSFKKYRTYNYNLSMCKVLEDPSGGFVRVHCHHCRDPMCAAACPTGACKKDEKTGFVTIDQMLCIGCKSCMYACPISIPHIGRGLKIMVKCDMCAGDPECIKVCSPKAIKVMSREDAATKIKEIESR